MKKKLIRWLVQLEKFADRPWYLPLMAFIAMWDMFLLFIPSDGLMISAAMLRPKKWIRTAVWMAIGVAGGALLFGFAFQAYGPEFVDRHLSWAVGGENWGRLSGFVEKYGFWAVSGIALGPFPIQPGVILGALGGMSAGALFVSVFVGRVLKNFLLCWIASHAPQYISKLWGIRGDVKVVTEAEKEVFLSEEPPSSTPLKRE